jgi:hypothetical protein
MSLFSALMTCSYSSAQPSTLSLGRYLPVIFLMRRMESAQAPEVAVEKFESLHRTFLAHFIKLPMRLSILLG